MTPVYGRLSPAESSGGLFGANEGRYRYPHGPHDADYAWLAGSSAHSGPHNTCNAAVEVIGQWRVGGVVGKGSFATVRRAVHISTGLRAVCKSTFLPKGPPMKREKARLYVLREVSALCRADHPNVVKLYDAVFSSHAIHLFEELVEGIELFDFLTHGNRGGKIPEPEARVIITQCLNALQHLHSLQIAHRDWKLDNVMIVPPHTPSNPRAIPLVKLIDFNLSAFFDAGSEMHETVGCIHYSSPWICQAAIMAERYAERARTGPQPPLHGLDAELAQTNDAWALAVGLFGMLQGYFPFRSTTIQSLAHEIAGTCRTGVPIGGRLSYPIPVSSLARSFIETGLDMDRPVAISQLLHHPWLAQVDSLAPGEPLLDRWHPSVTLSAPIPEAATDDSYYLLSLYNTPDAQKAALDALKRTSEALAQLAADSVTLRLSPASPTTPIAAAAAAVVYPSPAPSLDNCREAGYPVFGGGRVERGSSLDSGYGTGGSGQFFAE